jgi:acyl-CoA reductase-like NAD-dependent aldehyde dehydrogenase
MTECDDGIINLIGGNSAAASSGRTFETTSPIDASFIANAALGRAEGIDAAAQPARDGKSLPSPKHLNVTSRSPIGPVGVITQWNTLSMLSTCKIAPALAAGRPGHGTGLAGIPAR